MKSLDHNPWNQGVAVYGSLGVSTGPIKSVPSTVLGQGSSLKVNTFIFKFQISTVIKGLWEDCCVCWVLTSLLFECQICVPMLSTRDTLFKYSKHIVQIWVWISLEWLPWQLSKDHYLWAVLVLVSVCDPLSLVRLLAWVWGKGACWSKGKLQWVPCWRNGSSYFSSFPLSAAPPGKCMRYF